MSKQKPIAECAYCGHFVKTTQDHVIPKCLFVNVTPHDIPRVNACDKCNTKEKSKLDSYLRDMLVCDIGSENSPIAKAIFNSKFIRSIQKRHSQFARDAQNSRLIPWYSPSGILIGTAYEVTLPEQRIPYAVIGIVRGLQYAFTNRRLPSKTHFEVRRWFPNQDLETLIHITRQAGGQLFQIGTGDVFECLYFVRDGIPEKALYLLQFYQGVFFSITINYDPQEVK